MLRFIALKAMVSAAALAQQLPSTPDQQERFLNRVEARINMPAGAKPLAAYSRSYFPVDGGAKIMGVYSTLSAPGRRWVRENPGPFISDGGCAIVTVLIDTLTGDIESVECNGIG